MFKKYFVLLLSLFFISAMPSELQQEVGFQYVLDPDLQAEYPNEPVCLVKLNQLDDVTVNDGSNTCNSYQFTVASSSGGVCTVGGSGGGGTTLPVYLQSDTEVLHSRAGMLFWEGINEVPDTPDVQSGIGHVLTVRGTDDKSYNWQALNIYNLLKTNLVAGSNCSIVNDDSNQRLTINCTGGGGGGSGTTISFGKSLPSSATNGDVFVFTEDVNEQVVSIIPGSVPTGGWGTRGYFIPAVGNHGSIIGSFGNDSFIGLSNQFVAFRDAETRTVSKVTVNSTDYAVTATKTNWDSAIGSLTTNAYYQTITPTQLPATGNWDNVVIHFSDGTFVPVQLVTWKDTDGSTDINTASKGDFGQYSGTNWVKQVSLGFNQIQSDFDENNENSPAFIKNRPPADSFLTVDEKDFFNEVEIKRNFVQPSFAFRTNSNIANSFSSMFNDNNRTFILTSSFNGTISRVTRLTEDQSLTTANHLRTSESGFVTRAAGIYEDTIYYVNINSSTKIAQLKSVVVNSDHSYQAPKLIKESERNDSYYTILNTNTPSLWITNKRIYLVNSNNSSLYALNRENGEIILNVNFSIGENDDGLFGNSRDESTLSRLWFYKDGSVSSSTNAYLVERNLNGELTGNRINLPQRLLDFGYTGTGFAIVYRGGSGLNDPSILVYTPRPGVEPIGEINLSDKIKVDTEQVDDRIDALGSVPFLTTYPFIYQRDGLESNITVILHDIDKIPVLKNVDRIRVKLQGAVLIAGAEWNVETGTRTINTTIPQSVADNILNNPETAVFLEVEFFVSGNTAALYSITYTVPDSGAGSPLPAARIPPLPASRITSGVFNPARIPPITFTKLYEAVNDAAALQSVTIQKTALTAANLAESEVHIECFNMIGSTKVEHDLEEIINLRATSGTRYFSKTINIAGDKAIAARFVFSAATVVMDIVDINNRGAVSASSDLKISRIYAKPVVVR